MQTVANTKMKKGSGVSSVKALIVTLGLTSTFGLWALFSRELQTSFQPATSSEPLSSNPSVGANQAFLASLPPIPTLATLSLQPVSGQQLVSAPVQAEVVLPGKLYLGGAAPSAQTSTTVITTTRSSR